MIYPCSSVFTCGSTFFLTDTAAAIPPCRGAQGESGGAQGELGRVTGEWGGAAGGVGRRNRYRAAGQFYRRERREARRWHWRPNAPRRIECSVRKTGKGPMAQPALRLKAISALLCALCGSMANGPSVGSGSVRRRWVRVRERPTGSGAEET